MSWSLIDRKKLRDLTFCSNFKNLLSSQLFFCSRNRFQRIPDKSDILFVIFLLVPWFIKIFFICKNRMCNVVKAFLFNLLQLETLRFVNSIKVQVVTKVFDFLCEAYAEYEKSFFYIKISIYSKTSSVDLNINF
jgi:hypothetical protein